MVLSRRAGETRRWFWTSANDPAHDFRPCVLKNRRLVNAERSRDITQMTGGAETIVARVSGLNQQDGPQAKCESGDNDPNE